MSLSTITFLQAVLTFGLLLWRPMTGLEKTLHFVLFIASGFFGVVFLMAAAFTFWWPPAMPYVLFWSGTTVVLLGVVVLRQWVD
jgi:hypothetical protein